MIPDSAMVLHAWTSDGDRLSTIIPAYIAVISALVILVQKLWGDRSPEHNGEYHIAPYPGGLVPGGGRNERPWYKFKTGSRLGYRPYNRALGNLALFVLSAYAFTTTNGQIHWCLTFGYVSVLEVFAPESRLVPLMDIIAWAAYAYRDVWPLATFTLVPLDLEEGPVLWVKLVLLTVVAVIIPLGAQGVYIPVDPDVNGEIAPEQTASAFSLWSYSFLASFIFKAYRTPGHLEYETLPPLADYDQAKHLKETSFRFVDSFSGAGDQHVFWGFMRYFGAEYFFASLLLFVRVAGSMASPVATERLLNYLEIGGEGAFVRPWVWVSVLFIGPTTSSVAYQMYTYIVTKIVTQGQAIITMAVFEHSLRVRTQNKAESAASPAEGDEPRPSKKSTVGNLNNLVTSDIMKIVGGKNAIALVTETPAYLISSLVFLYSILGWSAFVGGAVLVGMMPVQRYFAGRLAAIGKEGMDSTDNRVQAVSHLMNSLRMVKLFGWEDLMAKKIDKTREKELDYNRKMMVFTSALIVFNFLVPIISMLATYTVYTVIMGQELNASKVFSSMIVFDTLRTQLRGINNELVGAANAKVSFDRLNDFLHKAELLDDFVDASNNASSEQDFIGFTSGAVFAWETDMLGSFSLCFDEELRFKEGVINLVVGHTGSGKSSLLLALLGEMHFVPNDPNARFSLPRTGGIAYATQESWVRNLTIKDNVLFGAPFDGQRYKKVLYQCGLQRDLALFEAGDSTEVGEKGLTLSGGQKARVTLARAIYSSAAIILLDDILASLDVHTARWVVEKCLKGDLVEGRTVIMVTHNVAMCAPISQFVVALGPNGRVTSQGSLSEALAADETLAKEVLADEAAMDMKETDREDTAEGVLTSGKLVLAEEVQHGSVSWKAWRMYFAGMSKHNVLWWSTILSFIWMGDIFGVVQVKWMGHWGEQYEARPANEINIRYYIALTAAFVTLNRVLEAIGFIALFFGNLRAGRILHQRLVGSILGTTLRWMDVTPTARVLTRCTQDVATVDGPLERELSDFISILSQMTVRLVAVAISTPLAIVPGLGLGISGWGLGHVYLQGQMKIKREMSNSLSPILSQFGTSVAGLTSIRAYGAEEQFKDELLKCINQYTRVNRTFYTMTCWVSVRMDAMGSLFTAALAGYLIYVQKGATAATTGFALNMAVGFSGKIIWLVRTWNEFEVAGNSVERITSFISIEQEPAATLIGLPPSYWPASGSLRVENLSARYSENGPDILHNLSFSIKSGERVGVVGRTGSGKSSLALALLRAIVTEGAMYFDNLDTTSVNVRVLRQRIGVVPQVPELLSGSLRTNLDPFEEHSDATLNDALRSAGLFSLQVGTEDGAITLDSILSGGGGNLSVGQRQIIALARALVRRSKLMIMDEATSAIDYETDTVIQKSLRDELPDDVTLITIAHRLQTIMDVDKIMVLDAGKLVEFGTPRELLKNEKGLLRALVDESGERDQLHAMLRSL